MPMMAAAKDAGSGTVPDVLARIALQRQRDRTAARERQVFLRRSAIDHYDRTRAADRIKPTPETKAKLKPCPIATLHHLGSIDDEERNAALEIEFVWSRLLAGMFARASNLEWSPRGARTGPSLAVATAYAERYKPWADTIMRIRHRPMSTDALARILPGLDRERLAQLAARTAARREIAHDIPPIGVSVTLAMAVDGKSGTEIDAWHLWRHQKSLKLITASLALYARIAGGHVPYRDPEE